MAIQIDDIEPRRSYDVGSTPQSAFTIPFPFFDTADIRCSVAGVELEGSFTVTGAGQSSGGTLTLSAPVSNTVVMVWRDVAIKRTSNYPAGGPFKTDVLNTDLNKQVAVSQQLADRLRRSLRLSAADAEVNMTLPPVSERAGRILAFSEAGEPLAITAPDKLTTEDVIGLPAALEAKLDADGDASAVLVAATGASAAPVPLAERFGLTVDVMADHGAKGDGETDDAPAFAAAYARLRDVGGGRLRVRAPLRHYLLLSPLEMGHVPVVIEGDGTGTTGLLWAHDGPCIHYASVGSHVIQSGPGIGRVKALCMTGLSLTGFANNCGAAIRAEFPAELSATPLFQARDLTITGHVAATGGASHGLWLTNAGATRLDNVTVHGRGTGTAGPPDAGASNQYAMRFGILLDSSGDAPKIMHYWNRVRVQGCHWALWLDGHFEGIYATNMELGPVGNALLLSRGTSANKILGAQFSNLHIDVQAEGISLNGVDGATFSNGLWLKNSYGHILDGNVVGLHDCVNTTGSGLWINCATPGGTNENGVYVSGESRNIQFSDFNIYGPKTAGVAVAGISSWLRFRGHVQDCGVAANIGPAVAASSFDLTSSNSGPLADNGAANAVDNLTLFGVVGDGTTNVTAPLNMVLGRGRPVDLPAGIYLVSGEVTVPEGVILRGAGRGRTVIKASAAGFAILRALSGSTVQDITLEGVPDTVAGSTGVLMSSVSKVTVSNVECKNFGFHGFALLAASGCQLSQIYAYNCGHRGVLIDPSCHDNTLSDVVSTGSRLAGVLLGHGSYRNVLSNLVLGGHQNSALWVHNDCYDNIISNVVINPPQTGYESVPAVIISANAHGNVINGVTAQGYQRGLLVRGAASDSGWTSGNTRNNSFRGWRFYGAGVQSGVHLDTDGGSYRVSDNQFSDFLIDGFAYGVRDVTGNANANSFSGFKFGTNTSANWSLGTNQSNSSIVDVAGITSRLPAAHLTDGLYLGGTASANKVGYFEEVEFTPTLVGATVAGSHTYAFRIGRAQRIGNRVTVNGFVSLSAKDGAMAGSVRIGGLPWANANVGGNYASPCISEFGGLATTAVSIGSDLPAAFSQIRLYRMSAAATSNTATSLDAADITNATYLAFSATYTVT